MIIYIDESVNVAIAEGLKRRGVNAFFAKDLGKQGMTDEEQLETAIQNKAAIFPMTLTSSE
jgi:predicted nuclease of predicted toxin-antitoxin system